MHPLVDTLYPEVGPRLEEAGVQWHPPIETSEAVVFLMATADHRPFFMSFSKHGRGYQCFLPAAGATPVERAAAAGEYITEVRLGGLSAYDDGDAVVAYAKQARRTVGMAVALLYVSGLELPDGVRAWVNDAMERDGPAPPRTFTEVVEQLRALEPGGKPPWEV